MKPSKLLTILTLLSFSALLLSACSSLGLGQADPTPQPATPQPVAALGVLAEGIVEPNESKYLSFLSAGQLSEVLVEKGEQVTEGQVLARLANSEEAQARLEAASLEVESAQQELDELNRTAALAHAQAWVALVAANQALVEAQRAWDAIDTQETMDLIEEARTEVADAQIALQDAQDDFEPYADLPQDNAQRKEAQQNLDEAEKAYSEAVLKRDELINAMEAAEANLEQALAAQAEAQYQYDQTLDGADPALLRLAEGHLSSAQAAQAAAQAALDNLVLEAPLAGEIMEVNVIPGELVSPATRVMLLADTSDWFIRTTDLTELEVVDIQVGQAVEVTPDAFPDLVLTGVVEEVSNVFRLQAGDTVYDVKIRLDEFDTRLKWGMTVEVEFLDQ